MKIESSCCADAILLLLFLKENYEIISTLYVRIFQLPIKSLSNLASLHKLNWLWTEPLDKSVPYSSQTAAALCVTFFFLLLFFPYFFANADNPEWYKHAHTHTDWLTLLMPASWAAEDAPLFMRLNGCFTCKRNKKKSCRYWEWFSFFWEHKPKTKLET